MKVTRKIIGTCLLTLLMMGLGMQPAYGQQELKGKKAKEVAEVISKDYKPWRAAGWTAKVRSDMLPVSVTMQTYMLRDSLTLISLRAPLFGEAARIEIDNNAVYIINKFKKCYSRINLKDYGNEAKKVHSNLQDILMGRVSIFNAGTLSKSNYEAADIYSYGDNMYLITGRLPEEYGSIDYGYAVDKTGRIQEVMAMKGRVETCSSPEGMESGVEEITAEATAKVTYSGKTADAALQVNIHGRSMSVTLQGMQLQTGVAGFARLDLRGYREVSLREVMEIIR